MTPEKLAEIDARTDKATSAPWIVDGLQIITADDMIRIADFETLGDSQADWNQMAFDVEFAAHARQDVPELVAEIVWLRAALTDMADRWAKQGDTDSEDRWNRGYSSAIRVAAHGVRALLLSLESDPEVDD